MAAGGFDCEFVTTPPKSLECPVCLLTVREPHVISCCGNQFCRPCIQQIQNDKKPCPLCNQPNFTTFLHKGVMREVNSLMVHCPQKKLGCNWKGELGQLQQHLNPGVKSQYKGCGYVMVDCVYKCGKQFPRRVIHEHELDECPRRPIEVQVSSLARKLDAVISENQAIKAENRALQGTVKQLQGTVKQLQSPIPPFYFNLNNVMHYIQNDLSWRSPDFYSHTGGYKMCCKLYPNGYGPSKGTYLSLFVGIMQGEYDGKLRWPFQGEVTIQIYSAERKKWGDDVAIVFDKRSPLEQRRRPIDSSGNPVWGSLRVINHFNLQLYCIEDQLRFKVSSVKL